VDTRRRLRKLEALLKARKRKDSMVVVFQDNARMKITGGMKYEGPALDGEKLLAKLEDDCLIVRFNIPRPKFIKSADSLEVEL
jgi:hypothetical protein